MCAVAFRQRENKNNNKKKSTEKKREEKYCCLQSSEISLISQEDIIVFSCSVGVIILRVCSVEYFMKIVMEKETTTNRKRKLAEEDDRRSSGDNDAEKLMQNNDKSANENDNKSKTRKEENLERPSLPSLITTNRPVRRKLCFDNVAESNDSERTLNNHEVNTVKDNKLFVRPCPFNVEVENLLNSTLEQNRKRCIEKYNFDPVLEKPLEGKYKWEKV